MVYTMIYEVDGGCRGNGQPGAFGAAAAIEVGRYKSRPEFCRLPDGDGRNVSPTNQRAEIAAIILALRLALKKWKGLATSPEIDLTIRSDSQYAVSSMNEWVYKWMHNGWINAAGNPVVNQDLIKEALYLDCDVSQLGSVMYEWIPRAQNTDADAAVNDCLDAMARERSDASVHDQRLAGQFPFFCLSGFSIPAN